MEIFFLFVEYFVLEKLNNPDLFFNSNDRKKSLLSLLEFLQNKFFTWKKKKIKLLVALTLSNQLKNKKEIYFLLQKIQRKILRHF